MYKLIGSPKTRAIRVVWMLEELGLDYEIDPAGPHSDAVLSANPSGKVPALKVGDDVIIDSVAICQYLADKHNKLTYPAGGIQRAQQDSWTHYALDDVDSILWFNAKNTFVLPEELRSEKAREACRSNSTNRWPFWISGSATVTMSWATNSLFPILCWAIALAGRSMAQDGPFQQDVSPTTSIVCDRVQPAFARLR